MKIGICLPHYGRPIDTGRLLDIVEHAERTGLDSIWVTDHVIVPRDISLIYRDDMLDPLAVLPWLAGVTERIALGTSVIVLPYRSPVPLAKHLASVDVLSGGRLIFGAAVGWLEGEFDALGVPMKERGSRTDEALQLSGLKVSPMPLQKPRPPILVGGSTEGAFRRVARLGDGWHASSCDPQAFRTGAQTVTNYWKEAGREGAPELTLRVPVLIDGVHRAAVDPELIGARGRFVVRGSVPRVLRDLRAYQAAGCSHVALEVSYSTYPAILETLDVLAQEIRPQLDGSAR